MSSSNGSVNFPMMNTDTPSIPRRPVSTGPVIFIKSTSLAPLNVKVEGSLKSSKFTTQVAPFSMKMDMNYPALDGSLILDNIEDHMKVMKSSVDRNQEHKFKWMPTKMKIKISRDSRLPNSTCDSRSRSSLSFFWSNLSDLKPTDVFFQAGRTIE